MAGRRKLASKHSKKRISGIGTGLMLTSMLDIFTTILFFLLKNYTAHVATNFNMGKDIKLPQSSALLPPPQALQLVVTRNAILLDDRELVTFVNGEVRREDIYRDGVTIVKLAQALQQHKKRSLYVEQQNDSHAFTGLIVLQADKDLPFSLLKKVIYTAGITDFVNLKLAVLKKEA